MERHLNIGVILNGPPGCGKDTIARIIAAESDFILHQFKDALYEHTARHFAVDLDKLIHYAQDRVLKDSVSLAGLGGRTPRQALIHVSEDIYKPRYGKQYFGDVEARRVAECARRVSGSLAVIYPDGGFPDEILRVGDAFDFVIVIRLHRNGFDFSGDSRDYVYLPDTENRISKDVTLFEGEINNGVRTVESAIRNALRKFNV